MSSIEDLDVDEKNAEEISEETDREETVMESSVSTDDAAVPFVQNSVTPAVEATDDGFVTGIVWPLVLATCGYAVAEKQD